MGTLRNSLLILFAILIDLLQAGISAGLFALGAFPGTSIAGAAGCAAGAQAAGSAGCAVAGGLAAVFGSAANPFLAIGTLPVAIALGFIVNFCLDCTLGVVLTAWLWWEGMYYPSYGITGFIMELIPGLNDMPGWTTMTVLSVMRKNAEEKLSGSSSGGMFTKFIATGVAGAEAVGAFALNQRRNTAQEDVYAEETQDQQRNTGGRFVSTELRTIDGIRPTQPSQKLA